MKDAWERTPHRQWGLTIPVGPVLRGPNPARTGDEQRARPGHSGPIFKKSHDRWGQIQRARGGDGGGETVTS